MIFYGWFCIRLVRFCSMLLVCFLVGMICLCVVVKVIRKKSVFIMVNMVIICLKLSMWLFLLRISISGSSRIWMMNCVIIIVMKWQVDRLLCWVMLLVRILLSVEYGRLLVVYMSISSLQVIMVQMILVCLFSLGVLKVSSDSVLNGIVVYRIYGWNFFQ